MRLAWPLTATKIPGFPSRVVGAKRQRDAAFTFDLPDFLSILVKEEPGVAVMFNISVIANWPTDDPPRPANGIEHAEIDLTALS